MVKGSVVRSVVVVVDFGKIMLEPGDHGIICTQVEESDFPLVHWANGYTCNASPADYVILHENNVARIEGDGKCPYHNKRK